MSIGIRLQAQKLFFLNVGQGSFDGFAPSSLADFSRQHSWPRRGERESRHSSVKGGRCLGKQRKNVDAENGWLKLFKPKKVMQMNQDESHKEDKDDFGIL